MIRGSGKMDDLYANWALVWDYFYPDRSEEMDFWAQLAAPYGQRVLDLMCGTAEVSLGLARRGYRVVGADLSPAMLAVAAERLGTAADYPARSLPLTQTNVCHLPVHDCTFDFALLGGTGSFNHLDDDQASVALRELGRVLCPGGGLAMELTNPYLLKEIAATQTLSPLRPTPPGVRMEQTRTKHYDRAARLLHIRQVTHYETGEERRQFEETFALHIREPAEVQALLEAAGFGGMRVYGDYSMGPYNLWSFALLVVATSFSMP
jgi:ubiquinone/menaquinone biosynthesis C-methylase UbiE